MFSISAVERAEQETLAGRRPTPSTEKAGNDVGRFSILFGQPVAVDVEGHGRAGVAETLAER